MKEIFKIIGLLLLWAGGQTIAVAGIIHIIYATIKKFLVFAEGELGILLAITCIIIGSYTACMALYKLNTL